MNQIAILHHFRKQETILKVVETASLRCINIIQFRKPGSHSARAVDGNESIPGPVSVGLVAGCAVGVVERFDDFWSQNIVRASDIEARFFVESKLISWRLGICGGRDRSVGLDPTEDFRTNTSKSALIRIMTAVHELEAEIDVFLLFEGEATEDERSTVETGKVLRFQDSGLAVILGQECKVRT